ncbi:unnamed protein product [Zymoseptoria tritici ST99CH_1A5]|uniref:Uncharacterized protein n=4 Tax=Zymoseptoria tritici TaxID=1047171 RepID=A0A1X7RYI1_ZYMT9|nr:unnamed protein product [Zymoseptoria tritici ST99CH_3D7]SMR55316.1 unnamed protein product [Zymoseptoria tritici ST99CH_1E4]SMY26128.1 unnamed protein product [Zymoseptoria tritici ST99CH_1A5]
MTTSGPTTEPTTTGYAPNESRRAAALPSRIDEPFSRQQRMQDCDPWAASRVQPNSSFPPPPGLTNANRGNTTYPQFPSAQAQRWAREEWSSRPGLPYQQDNPMLAGWATSPLSGQFSTSQTNISRAGDRSPHSGFAGFASPWNGGQLRRSSSEEARMNLGGYFGGDPSGSASSLQNKAFPQRRPSNRDEFDGPSQLLDKPDDQGFEPKEEDLPQLPITLYAQEQDEILSKVNDRLSQCAYDFVAKYQFPIPIEPDKRPVRVPGDREWSEWVYLLKRLATKRRIPARVLYNGQIKQLITILENSLEMRHAAKHQSRPLKDDRNILQLISSGLQVAKILKDAPAMQYLDSLYIQTERLIQSRRGPAPAASYNAL